MRTLAAFLLAGSVVAGADAGFLLRGVTVHPVTAPDIPNGSVLVRDGKIAQVGAKIVPPKGTVIVEAKGMHLWPGMINSATLAGLTEISSVTETREQVASNSLIISLIRSCVIGRGVVAPWSFIRIAAASGCPIQIGRNRFPSTVFNNTIGCLPTMSKLTP